MGNRDDEYDFLFKGTRHVKLPAVPFAFGFDVTGLVEGGGVLACVASQVSDRCCYFASAGSGR